MPKKDNRIALWRNEDRQKDTHPHFKGQATVNGVEYWASCWANKEATGTQPVMTLSLTPKEGQKAPQSAPQAASQPEMSYDDASDIPF